MKKYTKIFATKDGATLDEENRTATFIISTDQVDRMGESVEQSWDLKNYKNNPMVLWGHNPSEPENVLGVSSMPESEKVGDLTVTKATVKFIKEGINAKADMVWNMLREKVIKTVSVGFIPHTFKDPDAEDNEVTAKADIILADNELLEWSIVPIPANPGALALAYKEGSLSKKDVKFMIKSMEDEKNLLTKELENDKNVSKEKKSMTDEDKQSIKEMISSAVKEAVAEAIKELKATETEEPEPVETPKEDPKKEGEEEDAAKDGDIDQSGADDKTDPEELELSEEEQKEFEEEFNKEFEKLNKGEK